MILVTGGTGYIGSHTVVELLAAGKDVLILDNYANSSPKVLERIAKISGRTPAFREGDIRDADGLRALYSANSTPPLRFESYSRTCARTM